MARTVDTLRTTIMELEKGPDLSPDAPVIELKRALLCRIVDLDSGPETVAESPPNQAEPAPDDV
jgi:DNA-binding XRE family transcriptional regulator